MKNVKFIFHLILNINASIIVANFKEGVMSEISSVSSFIETQETYLEAPIESALPAIPSHPQPHTLSQLQRHKLLEKNEKSIELQIAHTRNFVSRHCNAHPQVMGMLRKALSSWMQVYKERGSAYPLERLLAAVMFAAEKHTGQTRQDGKTPYIIHPIGVAQFTLELGDLEDADALIAALLHDTIEDTDTTPEEILANFGPNVLALVLDLTKDPSLRGDPSRAQQIQHAPMMHHQAKIIKLADRYYNVCDVYNTGWSHSNMTRYILWGAKLSQVLRGISPKLEKAIDDKVTEHFHNYYPTKEVGRLAEAWKFPSDHLPVSAVIDGLEIASWNVLNSCFLSWVTEKDTQGLNGSLITTLSQKEREQMVVDKILEMIHHPQYPKQIICLQECGPEFLNELSNSLPIHMKISYMCEKPFPRNQNVVIYDSRALSFVSSTCDLPYENSDPTRPVQNLYFSRGEQTYQFINAHLPGDPNLPGRDEFASYVNKQTNDIVIAVGDMNFNRNEMQEAFKRQGNASVPFSLIPTYPTNIGLDLRSKGIDHIYVKGTFDWYTRTPEETQVGLNSIESLLSS